MAVSRREFVLGALASPFAAACARPGGEAGVIRVAYMGNLTHAPIVSGVDAGRAAKALAPLRLETRVVGAGPRVVEALLGGTVDVGVAGPAAIVSAQALHGSVLTIVSGVCSGGASLVLRRGERDDDLAGRTIATPQLGSTQDVSLRKWLRASGHAARDKGGDVRVTQMSGALAKIEIARGTLAGAWMPEPWATRIAFEAPAFRAFDERDLWPNGDFASAVVVARADFLKARPNDVARFVSAIEEEIARVSAEESRAALSRAVHAKWDARVWSEAWSRVRFTSDPMRDPIAAFARDAFDAGALRAPCDTGTLFT